MKNGNSAILGLIVIPQMTHSYATAYITKAYVLCILYTEN